MLKKTRYETHFLHIKQEHRIADRKQKLVPGNGEKKLLEEGADCTGYNAVVR